MLRKGMIWMPMDKKDQLAELISNAETSFYNGQLQEAFSLSLSAIKLDENCADAYQCAANVCMSLSRYEDAIEYFEDYMNFDIPEEEKDSVLKLVERIKAKM